MKLNADQAAAALEAEKRMRVTQNEIVSAQDAAALRRWCIEMAIKCIEEIKLPSTGNSTNNINIDPVQVARQFYEFMTEKSE